jgi:hypothetical protein
MGNQRVQSFTPTSAYKKELTGGFAVLINPEVLRHREEAAAMRQELKSQIKRIARTVPDKPMSALKKVHIWVEWEHTDQGAMFHPSAMWLKDHGYNPDKAEGIELSNTRNFINSSRAEQPYLVLHELSHAYHYLVLGDNHAGIKAAYNQAVGSKLYESVLHINGSKKKAYALTNAHEYYAELSEAYFGKNDYYPFTRTELEKHDPVGYQLMEETWGKPRI